MKCIVHNISLLMLICLGAAGCSKHVSAHSNEASVAELNQILGMWVMERGSYPKAIDELTNFPALQGKQLPELSPGKKLVLDPISQLIVITNE